MFSFAPFLYRDVLAAAGGPVARLEDAGRIAVLGVWHYQANAYLAAPAGRRPGSNAVYGNCDGSGVSIHAAVARHKAVSEALERWALQEVKASARRGDYGFAHDPSSNGMAAYPGFNCQARRAARLEALERWALVGWWAGHLGVEVSRHPHFPAIEIVRLRHGRRGEVVVLAQESPHGFYTYGHGAGDTLAAAVDRAASEMTRNEVVIANYRAQGALRHVTHFFERRALHFSTPEGHASYRRRLATPPDRSGLEWKVVYDGPIVGPWTRWAKVWRCCVAMPTYDFLRQEENFFFW